MDAIQQLVASAPQVASSAAAVASAMAKPKAASSTGASNNSDPTSSSAASDSSTITANDFLTLLVAEMKNQDPTQPTDPNAYISQMVDVNSLQQLIGINQGITSLDTAAGASTGSPTPGVSGTGLSQ
jgi:flagellar basal-body rod modification protein FlgD